MAVLAFVLACSPLLVRYAQRITDQSDEPLGVLAFAAAVWFISGRWREISLRPMVFNIGAVVLAAAQWMPLRHSPMLVGVLAVGVLGCAIQLPRGKAGLMTLLALSLPLMASLEFYAGYPLRLAAAELSAELLQWCGVDVERAGVMLMDHGNLVGIDPPCAGVRMLWTSSFTAAVVATRAELKTGRALCLLGAAVALCVLGNAWRAVIVFFPESGRVHWPHALHEGVGLAVHALVLATVFAIGSKMETGRNATPHAGTGIIRPCADGPGAAIIAGIALFTAALFAGVTLVQDRTTITPAKTASWPATLDGVPLVPLPLEERERRFADAFPGSIGRFKCGSAEVILRSVARPAREMHASTHCLRAAGFAVQEKPVFRDADHRLWGCCLAERDGHTWRVRERYTNSAQNRVCTDASAWFWEATLHPQDGPWLAVTMMEPM